MKELFLVLLTILVSNFTNAGPKTLFHGCIRKSTLSVPPPTSIVDETPIIILHGLLGSSRNFQTWGRLLYNQLDSRKDIVCMDLRNHGRTSAAYGPLLMDYDVMALDVLHTIKTLGFTKVHIIGHSMGGKVAAAAALKADSELQIKSLTMMDISPVNYDEEDFRSVSNSVSSLFDLNTRITPDTTKEQINTEIAAKFEDKSLQAFIQSNLQATPSGEFKWSFNVDTIYDSMDEIREFELDEVDDYAGAAQFSNPMMLIKGSDSDFVRSAHLSEVAKLFPLYNMQSVRGAGHWLHFDKPAETVSKIAAFLIKVEEYHAQQANA